MAAPHYSGRAEQVLQAQILTSGGLVDVIDEFISRYTREFDYYEQVGRLVAQRLQADLQGSGVRSIVTSRAKSATRLEPKCRQRANAKGEFANVEDIYEDIHDLAGTAATLPDQIDQPSSPPPPAAAGGRRNSSRNKRRRPPTKSDSGIFGDTL